MAFQSVPGVAEAVVVMTCNGATITNTFYFFQAGYTQATIQDLADEVDGWVDVEYLPLLSSQLTYVEVNCRGLEDINDLEASSNTNAGVGGDGDAPLPNNVALAVARKTGLTGRSARGRVFVPLNVGDLDTNENFVTNTAATNYVDALNALGVLTTAIDWEEVVVSRFTLGAARPFGITFSPVTYSVTDLRVDSQRGRLPA